MDDEAPPNGGLDARGGQRRSHWGRRTPYGLRRDSRRDDGYAPADGRSDATYAALDLGTNNCRLLIARPAGDGFRVVDAFSRIIRLGEGVAASRRISEAAIARAVEALQVGRKFGLDPALMARIDDVLGPAIFTDPAATASPRTRS